jgi:general secretion pathway protein H
MTRHEGFTLIEILIVMVLIATTTSLIVLQVRDRDDGALLQREIDVFLKTTNFAQEEMLFRSEPLGIHFTTGGYAWYRGVVVEKADAGLPGEAKKEAIWRKLDDKLLKARRFPAGMDITLYLEAKPVILDEKPPARIKPHVLFLPDTDSLPFELLFAFRNEDRRSIVRYPSGKIEEKGDG